LDSAISSSAADARLDVLLGGVLGAAGKQRRQRGLDGLEGGRIDSSSCRTPRRRAISCASCTLMPAV
jgi:hypothetical protein